jgi:hypothetical protein
MRNASTKATQSISAAEIPAEIERLSDLSLKDLRAAWAQRASVGSAWPRHSSG